MKTLRGVRNFLSDKIDLINHGGCGIAAVVMYRWLKENNLLRGDEKFVFLYKKECRKEYVSNSTALKFITISKVLNIQPRSCNHICLLYKDKYIDATKYVYPPDYLYMHKVQSEEFLLAAINNVGDWNKDFDRKSVIDIQKKLKIDLSDIKLK